MPAAHKSARTIIVPSLMVLAVVIDVSLLPTRGTRAADMVDEVAPRAPAPPELVSHDRAIVVHAAGAIIVSVPSAWHVVEVPYRREVRVAVAPHVFPSARLPDDCLWFAYHHLSRPPAERADFAAFTLSKFRALAVGEQSISSVTMTEVDGHPAQRIDFRLSTTNGMFQGFFVATQTKWGHCEFYAKAPMAKWTERENELVSVLDSVRLNPPQLANETPVAQAKDAEQILGSWKSYRGRLRLSADGRVSIITDRAFQYSSKRDAGRPASEDSPLPKPLSLSLSPAESEEATGEGAFSSDSRAKRFGNQISGRFQARDDLLLIVWDDGSKLNFRWRQQENRLLLTDHNGRTTQLRRILE